MTNASTSSFECRLINPFGDGHNHELSQYEDLKAQLERLARTIPLRGVLLGNVMCGSSSLDSLLLTQFGVFIVEFKSYGTDEVRISGQKEFWCYNADGTPCVDSKSGEHIQVKGGTHSNPFVQAQANRSRVLEALNKCFGHKVWAHVGVIVLFSGHVRISGLNQFSDEDKAWFNVIDSTNVEGLLRSLTNKRGLDKSQIEQFVDYIDATRDVCLSVDTFTQAKNAFNLGNYSQAYGLLKKCDPNRREVVKLKLQLLPHINDKREFDSIVTLYLDSQDREVRDYALRAMAHVYCAGKLGYPKDIAKCVEYISKVKNRTDRENEALELNETQKRLQSQIADVRKAMDQTQDEAVLRYHNYGRMATTLIFAASVIILVGTLISYSFLKLIPYVMAFALLGMLFLLAEVIDDDDDFDKWYFLKKSFDHFDKLIFSHVNIHESEWFGPRLQKTLCVGLVNFAILIIPFVAFMFIANKVGDVYASHSANIVPICKLNYWIVDSIKFNPFKMFLNLSGFYFVISALAYFSAYCYHAANGAVCTWSREKHDCNKYIYGKEYFVALPSIDFETKFNLPHSLYVLRHSLMYGGFMTIALIAVEIIRHIIILFL